MKSNKIFVWVIAITGIPLIPFIVIPMPKIIQIDLYVFLASLFIFGAVETVKRKRFLFLSLIILVAVIFAIGAISNFTK